MSTGYSTPQEIIDSLEDSLEVAEKRIAELEMAVHVADEARLERLVADEKTIGRLHELLREALLAVISERYRHSEEGVRRTWCALADRIRAALGEENQ